MRSRRITCTQAGFTLVEVLVAVAILAIGLAAVFGQITQAVFTASYLRDSTLASWIATDRITDLRLRGVFPALDETDGEIDMAGQTWRYTINISQTPLDEMRRIDVRVSYADSPDSILGKATGFVGRPGTGQPIPSILPAQYTAGELE